MLGTIRGFIMPIFSGKIARSRGPAGLRPLCLIALIGLVIQFVLGIIVNLYVAIPDYSHASYIQEIEKAPAFLTAHALVGLVLLVTAAALLIQAIALRAPAIITLVATGLAALLGAFIAGEVFVKNGADTASLSMSILTGLPLASYLGVQALAATVTRAAAAPQPGRLMRGMTGVDAGD